MTRKESVTPERALQTAALLADGPQQLRASAETEPDWEGATQRFHEALQSLRDDPSEAARVDLLAAVVDDGIHFLPRETPELADYEVAAATRLVRALDATPTAVIQAGTLLLVKMNGAVVVRHLTSGELAFLARNPTMLQRPEDMADWLATADPAKTNTVNDNELRSR